jgi:hypothetical protein
MLTNGFVPAVHYRISHQYALIGKGGYVHGVVRDGASSSLLCNKRDVKYILLLPRNW